MAPPSGTVNVERRTWDTAKYEQKARDREEYGDEYVDGDGKEAKRVRGREEFRPAEANAAGPAGSKRAFLKSREATMGLEKDAGKARILSEPELQQRASGWYCDVCDCLLRDSASYLDHVNGKKHQRALGFSMRVERVDVSAVRERLSQISSERQARQAEVQRRAEVDPAQEWEARLEQAERAQEDERRAKRDRKRRRDDAPAVLEEADEEEDDDDAAEMNALMGFGSFGGSKKS